MKARISKLLFCLVAAAPLLFSTGCSDEMQTAMWWMPSPWSPVVVISTVPGTSNGDASGGAAAGGGGGAFGGGFNTGGGYNVGGGVPGVGF